MLVDVAFQLVKGVLHVADLVELDLHRLHAPVVSFPSVLPRLDLQLTNLAVEVAALTTYPNHVLVVGRFLELAEFHKRFDNASSPDTLELLLFEMVSERLLDHQVFEY